MTNTSQNKTKTSKTGASRPIYKLCSPLELRWIEDGGDNGIQKLSLQMDLLKT